MFSREIELCVVSELFGEVELDVLVGVQFLVGGRLSLDLVFEDVRIILLGLLLDQVVDGRHVLLSLLLDNVLLDFDFQNRLLSFGISNGLKLFIALPFQ